MLDNSNYLGPHWDALLRPSVSKVLSIKADNTRRPAVLGKVPRSYCRRSTQQEPDGKTSKSSTCLECGCEMLSVVDLVFASSYFFIHYKNKVDVKLFRKKSNKINTNYLLNFIIRAFYLCSYEFD